MIGLDPDIIWRATGGKAEINRQRADRRPTRSSLAREKPLDSLRALIAESRIPAAPGLPPMAAGVFGYLGYDMVREMERLAPAKPDPIGMPDAIMIRPTAHGGVRRRARRNLDRDAGAARSRRFRARRL